MKSYCSGCKHWILCRPEPYGGNYDCGDKFHYCDILETADLTTRKLYCVKVGYRFRRDKE